MEHSFKKRDRIKPASRLITEERREGVKREGNRKSMKLQNSKTVYWSLTMRSMDFELDES
jgi:hypothetical protein